MAMGLVGCNGGSSSDSASINIKDIKVEEVSTGGWSEAWYTPEEVVIDASELESEKSTEGLLTKADLRLNKSITDESALQEVDKETVKQILSNPSNIIYLTVKEDGILYSIPCGVGDFINHYKDGDWVELANSYEAPESEEGVEIEVPDYITQYNKYKSRVITVDSLGLTLTPESNINTYIDLMFDDTESHSMFLKEPVKYVYAMDDTGAEGYITFDKKVGGIVSNSGVSLMKSGNSYYTVYYTGTGERVYNNFSYNAENAIADENETKYVNALASLNKKEHKVVYKNSRTKEFIIQSSDKAFGEKGFDESVEHSIYKIGDLEPSSTYKGVYNIKADDIEYMSISGIDESLTKLGLNVEKFAEFNYSDIVDKLIKG